MSRTLAEQLAALMPAHGAVAELATPPELVNVIKQRKPPRPPKHHGEVGAASEPKFPKLAYQLPLWGVVQRLVLDRGYGFLSCSGVAQEVFFHLSRQQPSRSAKESNLKVGTPVLFMMGSEAGKPDRRAVRWAMARDIKWSTGAPPKDQTVLDTLRRGALEKLPWANVWELLHAEWYSSLHGANIPPDLEDQVLEDVWFNRIAELTPDRMVSEDVRQKWRQCLFRFKNMPNVSRLLVVLSIDQLAAIAPPMLSWMHVATADTARQRLMEWHLLSNDGAIAPDWSRWFQGREWIDVGAAKFLIDRGLRGDEVTQHWIRGLILNRLLDQEYVAKWVGDSDARAFSVFEQLDKPKQREFWECWIAAPSRLRAVLDVNVSASTSLLRTAALAVDLETDGQAIWEIGCARDSRKELLYAKTQGGEFESGLEKLVQRLEETPLLVGHNLLAWDWPVLSQHIDFQRVPQLWDTLLMRYLLAPQASSHALGSNHHADEDALAALKLFDDQITCFSDSFSRQLILGEFASAVQMLACAGRSIVRNNSCARPVPDWLASCKDANAILVLPEHRLHEFDWVPGVTVVCANEAESLSVQWLQIDVGRLTGALQEEATNDAPTEVLLAVAQRAQRDGVALRYGMIPTWLLESSTTLDAAVRRASFEPRIGQGQGRCIAPMPRDVGPMVAAGPSTFRLVDCAEKALVFNQQPKAATELQALVKKITASPLVRVERKGDVQVWLQVDRPARLLEKAAGWRSFCTVPIPEKMVLLSPARKAIQVTPPILATRRMLALYPNAMDQAGYWLEVIRTFRELANGVANAVPILLVGSSESSELLDMLNISLAEIGWAELQPEHRSRLEHLRRATQRGYALVDRVDNWSDWQALAANAEVSLLPVVEALPLEQWYAAAQDSTFADATEDADDGAETDQPDAEGDSEAEDDEGEAATEAEHQSLRAATVSPIRPVGVADLLEKLVELLTSNLRNWLVATGLSRSDHPVRLMDARAANLGQGLKGVVALLPLAGEPLPSHHIQCLQQVFEAMQILRESAPSDYASMEKFLVEHWQPAKGGDAVAGFKESQKPAMEAICTRANDVLVVLPTGEGKSVLFQVPALCRGLRTRRLTLVLSPLKALMHDQVARLREQHFGESADYLSSDRPTHEINDVLQGVLDHRIVLLYVAPERLRSQVFVTVLRQRVESDGVLEYAVVDETHCVNQWGHQFRPDYFHALDLLLQEFRNDRSGGAEIAPMLLLSATVTASDRKQLQSLVQSVAMPDHPTLPFVNNPAEFVQPLRSHIQVQPVRVQGRINDSQAFDQVLQGRLFTINEAIEKAKANQSLTKQRSAVIIFVTRREHAERLWHELSRTWGSDVDYFHAGLHAATREEVHESFLKGQVNVLVATKAFGMGMDIPDIHWAIHLGPPAFLEDYLQEVGRIGRSSDAREKAQLDRMQASLLFSADDFESLRSDRARSELHLAEIKEFYGTICANAQRVDDQWMALVPQDGFNPPSRAAARRQKSTKLRMAIYWLERAGRLKLSGVVPKLLEVKLNASTLEHIAAGGGKIGLVARVILGIEPLPQATPVESANESGQQTAGNWLGRALQRLGDMVGFLLGVQKPAASQPPNAVVVDPSFGTEPDAGDAIINVGQIMLRCSIKSMSDVMACLVDLEDRGGLELKREFQFALRALALEPVEQIDQLFEAVGRTTKDLIERVGAHGKQRFDLSELALGYEVPVVSPVESSHYKAAFEWSVLCLARISGVRIRQVAEKDQAVRWEAQLPSSVRYQALERCNKSLNLAQEVFKVLRPKALSGGTAVSLRALVNTTRKNATGKKFQESELKKALRLLSSLKLVSMSADLLPMSYVLSLDKLDESLDDKQELWDEMEGVNRMAELRNNAMEIFANIPTEAQSGFIEGYFAQSDAAGLETYLITQLGNVDDGDDVILNKFITEKLEQLRATEVVKFFDRYKHSEEPNQWRAICHPFDQHLLVNAGPGAGKTAVLVGRVVHLIREQHIQPSEIIVLAFNRAVVFEIKKRVRELFRTLGYAAYVRRLRVSTFHSLAIRSLAQVDGGREKMPDREDVLSHFAKRLESDTQFRNQVAGGCKSILVDEFQDVTSDIYQIIRGLHQGSGNRAGVMVIGDDDQDILRWQRRDGSFSERYFTQFVGAYGGEKLQQMLLEVNFRSGVEIVEKSQSLVTGIFDNNQASSRLKPSKLRSRSDPVHSEVVRKDWRGSNLSQALDYMIQQFKVTGRAGVGSLAVLCRQNSEVAQAHRALSLAIPDLVAQGAVNYGVAELRHVGLWLEYLEREAQRQNRLIADDLKRELIQQFNALTDIPEARRAQDGDVSLLDLWELCLTEQSYAHISDLIRFIKDLQLDELGRLLGGRGDRPRSVVSTIHKVKGLEFDRVFVLPSDMGFGTRAISQTALSMDAAEEARLLYVAMTRAKSQLTYFVGDREYGWATARAFRGQQVDGQILAGSHDEVALGWSMGTTNFNPDPETCQSYIEKYVRVGDSISLDGRGAGAGKSLMHRLDGRRAFQVGFLASAVGAGGPYASLKVSAVVRFKPGEPWPGDPPVVLAPSVQRRGWGYVVLVAGQLR